MFICHIDLLLSIVCMVYIYIYIEKLRGDLIYRDRPPWKHDGQGEESQIDLKKLDAWSKEWQMVFNADKCKVLHFGHNNGQAHYIYIYIYLYSPIGRL